MLLYQLEAIVPNLFAQDLHAQLIWLRRRQVSAVIDDTPNARQNLSVDTFRWPVLNHAPTTGSPARTVKVFFEKQPGSTKPTDALLGLTAPVAEVVAQWLPEGVPTIALPNLEPCAVDPVQKLELWKRLQKVL